MRQVGGEQLVQPGQGPDAEPRSTGADGASGAAAAGVASSPRLNRLPQTGPHSGAPGVGSAQADIPRPPGGNPRTGGRSWSNRAGWPRTNRKPCWRQPVVTATRTHRKPCWRQAVVAGLAHRTSPMKTHDLGRGPCGSRPTAISATAAARIPAQAGSRSQAPSPNQPARSPAIPGAWRRTPTLTGSP